MKDETLLIVGAVAIAGLGLVSISEPLNNAVDSVTNIVPNFNGSGGDFWSNLFNPITPGLGSASDIAANITGWFH